MNKTTILLALVISLLTAACSKREDNCASGTYFPSDKEMVEGHAKQNWTTESIRKAMTGDWVLIKSVCGFCAGDPVRCEKVRIHIPEYGPCTVVESGESHQYSESVVTPEAGDTTHETFFLKSPKTGSYYLSGRLTVYDGYMITGHAAIDQFDFYWKKTADAAGNH